MPTTLEDVAAAERSDPASQRPEGKSASRWGPVWQSYFGWCSSSSTNKIVRDQRRRRKRRHQGIDAVENSTVTGKKLPAVLDTAMTLKLRLEKIADDRQTREPQDQSGPGDHGGCKNRSGISGAIGEG